MSADLRALTAGSVWRHRKGGTYVVLGVATCSTNGERDNVERSVMYMSTQHRTIRYREISEFMDGRFDLLASGPAAIGDIDSLLVHLDRARSLVDSELIPAGTDEYNRATAVLDALDICIARRLFEHIPRRNPILAETAAATAPPSAVVPPSMIRRCENPACDALLPDGWPAVYCSNRCAADDSD